MPARACALWSVKNIFSVFIYILVLRDFILCKKLSLTAQLTNFMLRTETLMTVREGFRLHFDRSIVSVHDFCYISVILLSPLHLRSHLD